MVWTPWTTFSYNGGKAWGLIVGDGSALLVTPDKNKTGFNTKKVRVVPYDAIPTDGSGQPDAVTNIFAGAAANDSDMAPVTN